MIGSHNLDESLGQARNGFASMLTPTYKALIAFAVVFFILRVTSYLRLAYAMHRLRTTKEELDRRLRENEQLEDHRQQMRKGRD